jgi:hypothetical protein
MEVKENKKPNLYLISNELISLLSGLLISRNRNLESEWAAR